MIRAWNQGIGRWRSLSRHLGAWHVCARCHRNQTNLHAIFALAASPYHFLTGHRFWSHACRPRARVIRACAVGIARQGAQIGRLGAPCKAGRALVLADSASIRLARRIRPLSAPVGRLAASHYEGQRRGSRGGLDRVLRGARTFAHDKHR